ncbi:MAG: Tim44-like domain-containing protein [Burkholderiaceae bacterium]
MKTAWIAVLVAGLALALGAPNADAKRLGGGKSTGMQRSVPDKPAPTGTPAQPTNPAATPQTPAAPAVPAAAATPNPGAAAAAAAPKRSWLGPVAGLAAGLGLAALASHLGMGEAFGNVMMIALLAIVAFALLRFVMRRMAGGAAQARSPFAMAGATAGGATSTATARQSLPLAPASSGAVASAAPATAAPALPPGFDAAAFERVAKMIFIRLQAAHDAGDLDDLRAFTTPEMFASVRVDLQDRGAAPNKTDVVTVNAELLDFAQEGERQIVSVRYSGLIREEADAAAHPFDEVWHLVRPLDGSRDWAIAGIQQRQ